MLSILPSHSGISKKLGMGMLTRMLQSLLQGMKELRDVFLASLITTQEKDVGLSTGQKLDHAIEMQHPTDFPVDDADRIRRKDHPTRGGKRACLDLVEHGHRLFGLPVDPSINHSFSRQKIKHLDVFMACAGVPGETPP